MNIKYETAILAKEKGFAKLCDMGFFETLEHSFDDPRSGGVFTFEYQAPRLLHNIYGDKFTKKVCEAPTLTELQLWIWNTHSIWVQSTPLFSANDCLGIVVSATSWKFSAKTFNYGGWDVQEALELGLFETLKLI